MVLAPHAADLVGWLRVWLGQIQDEIHRRRCLHAFHVQSHAIRRISLASPNSMIETIQWTESGVVMIDQTRLPREESYVTCTDYQQVAEAIRSMVIRGAPAIGVAAAMGIALGMQRAESAAEFDDICDTLTRTRPTAVNLFWAIARMRRRFSALHGGPIDEIRSE